MKKHLGKFERWSIYHAFFLKTDIITKGTVEDWKKHEMQQSFDLYLDLHRIGTKIFLGQKNVNIDWVLKYIEESLIMLVRILLFWLYKKIFL